MAGSDGTAGIFQLRFPSAKKTEVPGIFLQLLREEEGGGGGVFLVLWTKQGTPGPGLSTQRDLGVLQVAGVGQVEVPVLWGELFLPLFFLFLSPPPLFEPGAGAFSIKSFFRNWFS